MNRIRICRVFLAISALWLVVPTALATTVVVGTCLSHRQSYSTISQAVSSVPSGSIILVCPGVYAEQVTITQPLTLKGVPSANTSNPTIVVPSGGLTKSVIAPTNGITMFFQVLVQGTESGLVNISNLAVNGSSNANKNLNGWIEGIYYQNSSGTVSNAAAYGQNGNGYGFGIFLEGTTAPAKTVTVKNNSVHDFDSEGIRTNGSGVSLTVNITSNSVVHSNSFSGNPAYGGIDVQGAMGTISNNRVITHPAPPGVSAGTGIAFPSSSVVTGNTVENFSVGIWALGNSNSVKTNQVSLTGAAIVISGDSNDVENNSLLNLTRDGGAGISFNCTGTSNTVIHNLINDAAVGIVNHTGNLISPNTYSNVAVQVSPPC
jgi:hypothetical protein